jgi:hypothetical protein
MTIKVRVRGIEELKAFFAELPSAVRRVAVQEAAKYLIGDQSHGLKHLVAYKYVTRKSAYGVSFFSEKQRRYVMARIREKSITPGTANRTGATSAGWGYKSTGGGYGAILYNDTKGAEFTQGDTTQARQPAKVGHRKVSDVISTNINGAIQRANQAVQRWINSHR